MKHMCFTKLCAFLLGGTLLLRAASAGEPAPGPGKATPIEPAEDSEGLFGGIGVEWSAGYDTHYVFRGELLQENTAWTQFSWDIALTESLSLNVTPWFLQDLDSDYSEFDLNAGLTLESGGFGYSLGYAGYFYPRGALGEGEGIDDEHEMWLSVTREFGPLSATVLGAYNFTRDAAYFELAAEWPLKVTEWLTLTPGVILGADTDYFDEGTDFNHVGVQLSAAFQLTPWCHLVPYIAANFPFGHLDTGDNLYGGVKVAIVF
ncbi:MAG: hypothetical protein ACR2OZ_14660 [Verrucomicrobiales bacterium]